MGLRIRTYFTAFLAPFERCSCRVKAFSRAIGKYLSAILILTGYVHIAAALGCMAASLCKCLVITYICGLKPVPIQRRTFQARGRAVTVTKLTMTFRNARWSQWSTELAADAPQLVSIASALDGEVPMGSWSRILLWTSVLPPPCKCDSAICSRI